MAAVDAADHQRSVHAVPRCRACDGTLPLGSDVATRWAGQHAYPLDDAYDLARVAQYVGVHADDAMFPKDLITEELKDFGPAGLQRRDEPHAVLAALPLPIYMTTNYDDFMSAALRHAGKEPRREICRWNASPAVREWPTHLGDEDGLPPSPANPIVYHLHGHLDVPESIVLTEDDYLDFLVAVSRDEGLLPHQIQRALAGTSLLFVGYRLSDWDFRVHPPRARDGRRAEPAPAQRDGPAAARATRRATTSTSTSAR